tara:strand:+ start:2215 stop:3429 length:1215 start_codon:yes stop_codon:yes gene_type:complete
MKASYKKYNKGGPVKPKKKKRKKEFTDRTEFLNRLGAYNDSLYAANTSEATLAYLDEALVGYDKRPQGVTKSDSYGRISYADMQENTNTTGKPYDLNVTATKDNFVFPSTYETYFGDDQLNVNTTSTPLSYQNYLLKNPQRPVAQYTYRPPQTVLSDTEYSVDPNDDRISTTTYEDGNDKGSYINYERNPRWRYNHRYNLDNNIYDRDRSFTINRFQQPNVEPVYTGEPNEFSDAQEFSKDMNKKVDSLYNTPGAYDAYESRFMKDMLENGSTMDTSYYDPDLDATIKASIYDKIPGGKQSSFNIGVDYNNGSVKASSKKPVRQKETMVDLPSKLPFSKMDLNSMPKIPLRNPLPTIYSRKLNQQSQEYVYDTSHGEIRKKVGQEDATFYNILRSQMEQMRANR